jgi:hypothetical protein
LEMILFRLLFVVLLWADWGFTRDFTSFWLFEWHQNIQKGLTLQLSKKWECCSLCQGLLDGFDLRPVLCGSSSLSKHRLPISLCLELFCDHKHNAMAVNQDTM